MEFEVPKGKYVVAVSGGVDSVVLLDMLATGKFDCEFVVAHFDHGIRQESKQDAEFVAELAKKYSVAFEIERAELGEGASEDQARIARYDFLRRVCKQTNSQAIITAHHQDDLLETILLHIQRGTGRAGLTPMQSEGILRPLLYMPKNEILQYAAQHKLTWHDDSTNLDLKYARNKIRALLADADPTIAKKLLSIYKKMALINGEIDALVQDIYDYAVTDNQIVRARFVQLPYSVQKEFVYVWLKNNNVADITKRLVEGTVVTCKTYAPHKKMSLTNNAKLLSQQKLIKILQK